MRNAVGERVSVVRIAALGLLILVVFGIGSCGGGGGDSSQTSASKLFVADSGNLAIGSTSNTNPSPGTVRVERIIQGMATNGIVGNIPALMLDIPRDQLYVSNEISIVVFSGAGTANGSIRNSRTIATFPGSSGNFNSLQLDAARDMLYVGDLPLGVVVYNNASTSDEPGGPSRQPDRIIATADIGVTLYVRDIALDTVRDILYVAVSSVVGPATMSILVFDGAHALNGQSLTPSREIVVGPETGNMALFVDSTRDRLYFARGQAVSIYQSASSQTGSVSPDALIVLPITTISRLAVDTVNDRVFAAAGTAGLYVVSSISNILPGHGPAPATGLVALPNAGGNFTAVTVRP